MRIMARNRKEKNKKNPFFLKKWFIGIAAALGISAVGLGTYEAAIKNEDKQLEQNNDLDELGDIVDNSREKQTIEDEIKNTLNKGITLAEDKIEESLEKEKLERKEELVKETIEETIAVGKELLPTESLEKSKAENKTITSYSAKYNYDNLIIPIIKDFETNSIIDALNEVGYDSSLTSRARLAVYFNIVSGEEEFEGLAIQNTTVLECLREYARGFQNSVSDDYIKVIDNSTIENSASNDGYTYDYAVDDSIQINQGDKIKEKEDIKDNGNKDHELSWSEWKDLDDENEYRIREDGLIEKRNHSYSEWIDNGDGTESKTCSNPNCGHVVTRDKHKHRPEAQAPVSLNATDEENCAVIKFICPDDGEIDESLTTYLPHDLPDTPDDVIDNEGLFTCKVCGMEIIKEIEIPPQDHRYEETAPVSLNATDEENCAVIKFICPDDGEIDESLTKYLPHDLPDTPDDVIDNEGLFTCKVCGMGIIKEITSTIEEEKEKIIEIPEVVDDLTIDFDFDSSKKTDEEYVFIDDAQTDITLDQVRVLDNNKNILNEKKAQKENLLASEKFNIFRLEDKHAKSLLEDQHINLQDVLAKFDTKLYQKLFKQKEALEQSLLASNNGIKREEKLHLIRYIDVIKANMVQELATALVQDELQKIEDGKGQELIFKV